MQTVQLMQIQEQAQAQYTQRLPDDQFYSSDDYDHIAAVNNRAGRMKERADASLSNLTEKFTDLVSRQQDGKIDLNHVAQQLNVPKRRIYDITNVLEGIGLVEKMEKNIIQWKYSQATAEMQDILRNHNEILENDENQLDYLIEQWSKYMSDMLANPAIQDKLYFNINEVQQMKSFKDQYLFAFRAPEDTQVSTTTTNEPNNYGLQFKSNTGQIHIYLNAEKREYVKFNKLCQQQTYGDCSTSNNAEDSQIQGQLLPHSHNHYNNNPCAEVNEYYNQPLGAEFEYGNQVAGSLYDFFD